MPAFDLSKALLNIGERLDRAGIRFAIGGSVREWPQQIDTEPRP